SPHWNVVVNLLAGSLLGAWMGATAATRMRSATLYRVLAVLLALIALVLVGTHLGTVDDLGVGRCRPSGRRSGRRVPDRTRGIGDGCCRWRTAHPDDRAAVRPLP